MVAELEGDIRAYGGVVVGACVVRKSGRRDVLGTKRRAGVALFEVLMMMFDVDVDVKAGRSSGGMGESLVNARVDKWVAERMVVNRAGVRWATGAVGVRAR